MFGGVAQTYRFWEVSGEPYKKDANYYLKVIHPITQRPKEVRFYPEKKYAVAATSTVPFCRVFGFDDESDYILAIKKTNLSAEEEQQYFAYKWRGCVFFGGIWYAPKFTEIPPIKNSSKILRLTWEEFKAAGQANSLAINIVNKEESPWFK